jgi:hypothetical protein
MIYDRAYPEAIRVLGAKIMHVTTFQLSDSFEILLIARGFRVTRQVPIALALGLFGRLIGLTCSSRRDPAIAFALGLRGA